MKWKNVKGVERYLQLYDNGVNAFRIALDGKKEQIFYIVTVLESCGTTESLIDRWLVTVWEQETALEQSVPLYT